MVACKALRKRRHPSPVDYLNTASRGFVVGSAPVLVYVLGAALWETIEEKKFKISQKEIEGTGILCALAGGLTAAGSLYGHRRSARR